MAKLFALEDGDDKDHLENNELLIDKVLNYSKQAEKSPMTLTADVLNQRQQLKKEINEKLNEEPVNADDDTSSGNEGSDDGGGDNNETNTDDNADNNTDGDGEDSSKDKDTKKDDDDGEVADDKDALSSVVGSGLKEGDDKDKKDTTATESHTSRVTLSSIFAPLQAHYRHYSAAMETFNLGGQKLAMEEQPIVYVKDAIVKSLNNLIAMANTYISNNNIFVEKNGVAVKAINEKISIFRQFVEAEKFHFTNKLVSDRDILSNVACPEKSDLTETARVLLNYVEDSTKANALIINNPFNKMSSGYTNQNFETEGTDLVYKTVLPGFNIVRLHLEQYRDYIKTDIQEYQYYKLKVLKTEDLYNLDAISITEDRDLNRLLDLVDKLIVNISLTTDNLKDINTHFTKFIDDIKVVVFDLDKDKLTNLASIDIDSKVQDFIKFKLAIESSYINMNMMIEYLSNIMSVLNVVVELKD